jgi:hypothetical protein
MQVLISTRDAAAHTNKKRSLKKKRAVLGCVSSTAESKAREQFIAWQCFRLPSTNYVEL